VSKIRIPRPKQAPRKTSSASQSTATKVKIAGKDDAPLSMEELRDGLYHAMRELSQFQDSYRAKYATLYLTLVDESGKTVQIAPSGEWLIHPYKVAAKDYGA
jgi:hypothetical protein